MKTCKVCKGYGYRYRQYGSRDHQARKQDCEYCGGSGKVESAELGFSPTEWPERYVEPKILAECEFDGSAPKGDVAFNGRNVAGVKKIGVGIYDVDFSIPEGSSK